MYKKSWLTAYGLLLIAVLFIAHSLPLYAQFTTDRDTLLILSGDSTTVAEWSYDATADTSGGTPYSDYTAGFDLNGKYLVGVDFDTTSAWTSAKFAIQTSATYNSDADTTGGTPYDWKTVNYEGTVYTFTPETKAINYIKPEVFKGLKRYIRIICQTSGGGWENEAALRKLIPLLRSGY